MLVAVLIGQVIPVQILEWLVAGCLLGFGVFRLLSSRHPRFGGMQVGAAGLTLWSLLMASAHGAGLMVVPFVIGDDAAAMHGGLATPA